MGSVLFRPQTMKKKHLTFRKSDDTEMRCNVHTGSIIQMKPHHAARQRSKRFRFNPIHQHQMFPHQIYFSIKYIFSARGWPTIWKITDTTGVSRCLGIMAIPFSRWYSILRWLWDLRIFKYIQLIIIWLFILKFNCTQFNSNYFSGLQHVRGQVWG